ncbi:MAG TPA: cupin domain-containing protein [Thermoanaerobaculia bacterium]|nr:cupin domain-containing protein [Thermoanaerobaculia bacterium]
MFRPIAAAILLSAAFVPAVAGGEPIAFTPEVIGWADGPPSMPAGSKIAVLEGDPLAEGMFTIRVRIPAGAALAPHWHPRDERVTVLSGAAELGFGNTADRARVTRYEAGSFYVNPQRVMHYLFFPEETVLQMTGIGPWEIHSAQPAAQPEKPVTATLELSTVDPPAHSVLGDAKSITAVVDYEIRNFRPSTFYLSMQFETTTANQTFSSTVARVSPDNVLPPQPNLLAEAKGTYRLNQELEPILRRANLMRPIRFRIFLHEQTSETTSEVVAATDWVEYR